MPAEPESSIFDISISPWTPDFAGVTTFLRLRQKSSYEFLWA